jgi:hypothetical protein
MRGLRGEDSIANCVDEKAFSDLHEGKDAKAVIIEKMQ